MEGVEHAPRLAGIVEGGELFQEQAQAVARQVRAGTDLADVGRKGVGGAGAGGHGRAPCRIRSRHGNTPSVSPQETGPPSRSSKFQAVPYPGQLWKHDSIRVIVVAVSPNTVTFEDLSRRAGVTRDSLSNFLAGFTRLTRPAR